MPRTPKLPRGVFEKDKGSRIYWIRYTSADGRRHREVAGALANAIKLLVVRRNQKLEGKLPEKGRKKAEILFKDLVADAILHCNSENDPKVAYGNVSQFNQLLPTFGGRWASTITRQEVVSWLDKEEKRRKWKPASYNDFKFAISLIFRVGIQNEKIDRNPVTGIRSKHADNSRCRYLTQEEEKKLVTVLQRDWPQYLPMFMLSIHTGMRKSEQLRSVVGDLKYETRVLKVHQKKDRNAPKVRYVPVTPIAIKAYEDLADGKKQGDSLCTSTRGEPLADIKHWFKPALKKAGIKGYTWHDNRHTACSRWVMAGVPMAAVAKFVGHATMAMTMRYTHLSPDAFGQASDRMMSFYPQQVGQPQGVEGAP